MLIKVTYHFIGIMLFVIYSTEIMFALNFKTAENMFTNSGTCIYYHQTVCKEQEPYLHLHFSWNYALL